MSGGAPLFFRRVLIACATSASVMYGSVRLSSSYPTYLPDGPAPRVAVCIPKNETGVEKKKLPYYTADEVASHNSLKGSNGASVWVTYKGGVYDITDFVNEHPGGSKRIMLAAGSGIDKWWQTFTIHDDDAVRDILERHRIGNLKGYVPTKEGPPGKEWENQPKRSPGLQVLTTQPYNAQAPEGILDEFVTPNDLFFVRNHMPVPDLANRPDFCVQVEGEGIIPRCYTLAELRREFAEHTISATIECGGNRRSEMGAQHGKGVKGLAWENGSIGNAYWTGVWLRDVIAARQVSPPARPELAHVEFEGADHDAAGHFHISIPYGMATDRDSDVMIAYKMNGVDLPPDHGYPMRAIVPGSVGVRNCKWLQRVRVQAEEAQSVWQQNDYKFFPPWETTPNPAYKSVYAVPVQSSLTDAVYNAATDSIDLKAYTYCGGGTGIQRVEVSYDGGKTFEHAAQILPPPPGPASHEEGTLEPKRKQWSWRMVSSSRPLDEVKAAASHHHSTTKDTGAPERTTFNVCIRAITNDNQMQPEVAPYNFRGLLYNGYSCREVEIS